MSKYDTRPVLLAEARVAERYSVSTRSLARWDNTPELGFPVVVRIRGRRYRSVEALDEWDRTNARKAAARHAHEHAEHQERPA